MIQNVLIIVANPKPSSLSFTIADAYKKNVESKGMRVEILDLYTDPYRQDFFTYDEDPYKQESTLEMLYYQNKIKQADEIVFVFPYWWGSMPAILKNFFDWNFAMGFAARYEKGRPVGLLTDKSVRVFVTTGAPSYYYMLTGANRRLKNMFKEQIFDFCGMQSKGFHIFGGIDSGATNVKRILEKIEKL